MPVAPWEVELNSVRYRLWRPESKNVSAKGIEIPYREYTEPALMRQPGLAGTSFTGARETRPDILSWKLDDWSGGEGVSVFDSSSQTQQRQYKSSSDAVNVAIPGKLKLGRKLTEALAIAAGDIAVTGPYVAALANKGWAFFDEHAKSRAAGDIWTTETTGAGTEVVQAPVWVYGGYAWVGYNTKKVRRINVSGATEWTAADAFAVAVTNARLYVLDSSNPLRLLQYGVDTALPTAVVVGTLNGLAAYNTSGIATIGTKLFFVAGSTGEEPRLFQYDGETLTERMQMPKSFRMDISRPIADTCSALNDVVFVGGWFEGDTDIAALMFVKDDTSGILGLIREGTAMRITSIAATGRNELLIGTRQAGNLVEVYRYDMATGGLSLFARKTGYAAEKYVSSIARLGGNYLIGVGPQTYSGTATGTIERTDTTNLYVASTTVTHPVWDFDLPVEEKILYEVEVHTETLPANTSVKVSFVLDDTTTVTTDINGSAMTMSSGARTLFQLNQKFRFIQPKIELTTSAATATPVVLSVTLRAITVNFIRYYDIALDLNDDTATARRTGEQITGKKKLDNLRTLLNNKAAFTSKFFFPNAGAPATPAAGTSKVTLIRDLEIREDVQGEGYARVTLRELS